MTYAAISAERYLTDTELRRSRSPTCWDIRSCTLGAGFQAMDRLRAHTDRKGGVTGRAKKF